MSPVKEINLYGRVIIQGTILAVTGLHVGKGKEGVTIGGVDNPVMRDTLTDVPFIPGSSLKGKLRSLAEKRDPKAQPNKNVGQGVFIHVCEKTADYVTCQVCRIYGVPGQSESSAPTRLVVRDVFMTGDSNKLLTNAETDLPFTEIKYEASIDRVTSAANPRPLERVPAGTEFGPFEFIYSIYAKGDINLLPKLIEAMCLLEDDYLGGSGSRGSGKIKFNNFKIFIKPVIDYGKTPKAQPDLIAKDLADLQFKEQNFVDLVRQCILVKEG